MNRFEERETLARTPRLSVYLRACHPVLSHQEVFDGAGQSPFFRTLLWLEEPLDVAFIGSDQGGPQKQRPGFILAAIKPQVICGQEEQNGVDRVDFESLGESMRQLDVIRRIGAIEVDRDRNGFAGQSG